MTPNADLATQAIRIADDHMSARKGALVAAVALSTTRTVTAAKRALQEWEGPEPVKRDGIALIDDLVSVDHGEAGQ